MAEIKRTFTAARMNKDLDERLVKNGEYRDAMNIQIRTTDGDASGTVQNVQGNTPFAYSSPSTYLTNKAKVIGSVADEKNNKAYFLVSSPDFDITVTEIDALTYWMDSIIEVDSKGFNNVVLNDLYAFSSTRALAGISATADTNSINMSSGYDAFFKVGMKIQLYASNGTALLTAGTKILTSSGTTLTVNKQIPTAINSGTCEFVIASKPRVLNFSQSHQITGINVIDEYLFFTDGRSEPKKINIKRCKEGTTQLSSALGSVNYNQTKLHLNHQATEASLPITSFETDHIGDILEEHVTVIRKAPRTAPTLNMSNTTREGVTQLTIDTTSSNFTMSNGDQEFSESIVSTAFTVLETTSTYGIKEGDVINFESLDDESYSPTTIRVRCTEMTSSSFVFTITAISTGIPATFTQWRGTLEQPKPFFELKFPRFGYRYKYNDGEYSSFSPFSEIAFLPGEFDFDAKNAYNLGMENNLRELTITNFLPEKSVRPDDIESVDILYKSTDSPTVYVIKTIDRDLDPEWKGINGEVAGEVKITSDMVYKVVPDDQILRSFDNVPRFAKAQEVIANRLIYANYTQGYDLGLQPAISLSLNSTDLSNTLTPEKSIKSLRNYKVGFLYGDKYGRETAVISPGDRSYRVSSSNNSKVLIEHSDTIKLDKNVSTTINKFVVQKHWQLGGSFSASVPLWADYVKYYIKETSSEYYNLAMDRWYNAEDGNIWISFASSDRNKIDEETYLILKNEHGTNIYVEEEARFKVIAISNEAPDFIKTDRRRFGDTPVDGGTSGYEGDIGYNFTTDVEEELRVRRTFALTESTFFSDNHEFKGVPRVRIKAISRDANGDTKNIAFTNFKKVTKLSGSTEDDAGSFDIQFAFGDQASFIQHFIDIGDYTSDGSGAGQATHLDTGVQYFFEFVDDVVENKPEFDGRFFVKIARDSILDKYVIGTSDSNTVYTPDHSYSIAYIDTNSYNNPAEGTSLNANYNWNGFNADNDFATNVVTQFAGTQGTQTDSTIDFWENYRTQARTPVFIDAADAHSVFESIYLYGDETYIDLGPQGINLIPEDFPLDGASRGFAKSGLAANETFDRLYFSVTRSVLEDGTEINGNRFQMDNPTGQFMDSVTSFHDKMSTPGTMFKFRNDPTNEGRGTIYRITSGSETLSGGFSNFNQTSLGFTGMMGHNEAKQVVRQTFYTTFRKVNADGSDTDEGIDFSVFDPRSMFKHDGMSTVVIDIVDRVDTLFDSETITTNSAMWETEPKESIDLDIFYEASNAIPLRLNEKNTSEFAPIGSTVKVFTNNVEQVLVPRPTVTKVYNSIVELKYDTSLATSGIDLNDVLVFVHKDGTETRSSVVSFIAADIESSGLVKTSASATGYYQIDNEVHDKKVLLPWSNCFTFGNGVESNRIRDDFNAPFIDNGVNVSTTSLDYKQENITNGFIFSGIYNSNSSVNNLNEFNVSQKITKEINPSYGSIQALKARDADLITFTEDKVLKVLANKDALFNADGNVNLTASDRVLGQAVPYVGDYGISRNPESLAVDQFRMYFTDRERGAVLRLSRDGLTPISNVGMRNYFRQNLPKSNSLIGSFDIVSGEYNLSITFKPEFGETDTTVSFNEASKGWVSFKSFVTDSAVSMSGEYYSSKEHIVYKHHVDSAHNGDTVNRNTFYSASIVNSYIDFIFNDFLGSIKNFKAINYEGSQGFQFSINNKSAIDAAGNSANYTDNSFAAVTSAVATIPEIKGWKVTSVNTDLQQGKVIDFSKKEGKWYGNIVGDFDVSNTTFNNVTVTSDPSELSTQGLGVPSEISYTDSLAGVFNLIIQ